MDGSELAAVLVGRSEPIVRVRSALPRLVADAGRVLFRGESGVGKSLAARIVMAFAPVTRLVIDCRDEAGSTALLRDGANDAWTVLAEDVNLASPRLQACLARVRGRLLMTTRADTDVLIRRGLLNPELCAGAETVWLPPLRHCTSDIELLAIRLYERHQAGRPDFTPSALALLGAQRWPGNVAQLERVVMRLAPNAHVKLDESSVRAALSAEIRSMR